MCLFLVQYLAIITEHLNAQEKVPLKDGWEFRLKGDSIWRNCVIPNAVHKILWEKGLIEDPMFSGNEKDLQRIGQRSSEFRTVFTLSNSALQKAVSQLVLPGVDCFAEVFFNGHKLGTCNNAFRTWSFGLDTILKEGPNELLIRFHSSDEMSTQLYNRLPTELPGGERVMVRKPQYHFGWDFGPKFIWQGITHVPYLKFDESASIERASIITKTLTRHFAEAELVIRVHSLDSAFYNVQWKLDDQIFSKKIKINPGSQYLRVPFRISNPKLWWPNGLGDPYLYKVRIQLSDSAYRPVSFQDLRCGIRRIDLINKSDKWGKGFYFKVNGHPVFAKGANYIPQDIFETDHFDHRPLLEDVYRCGFNMLRVWGGGRYESDAFYGECDRLGIMVWQDFMFACGMVPGDQEFRENVREEAEQQVFRLSQFACIALWCGNNEIDEAWHRWGWQTGLSASTKERLWGDYQEIFNNLLPLAVSTWSNYNSYWPSSPLWGRGDSRFQTEGDAHDWGIWHDEMKFEAFEQRIPRFMSEAGFQSIPDLSTVLKFCPPDQLDLESLAMMAHQKHPRGNKLIRDYLRRDLPEPENFESLIYLNQLNQAEGIGLAIKAHLRAKPYCMGTLYWQLNDCWPGISWSGRDYYGHWKALQHKTRLLYQPLLISARESGDFLEVFASSDLHYPESLSVQLNFMTMDGQSIHSEKLELKMKTAQSKRIYLAELSEMNHFNRQNVCLVMQWKYNNFESQDVYYFDKLKNIPFKKPFYEITNMIATEGGFSFDIRSDQLCKAVYLKEYDNLRYFPNFFDLAPGIPQKVFCKTDLKEIDTSGIQPTSFFDHLPTHE